MKQIKSLLVAAACLASVWSASGVPYLFEVAVNIDGAITDDPYTVPGSAPSPFVVGLGGNGLGTASFTITGAGAHFFDIFFDLEIDQTTYTQEIGFPVGAPGPGQTWEIDEPVFGDIYANFAANALDNTVGAGTPDDVSMALGWNFNLLATEQALLSITVSETAPSSGFYLQQQNTLRQGPDIFLYGSLDIGPLAAPSVPEGGATLVTLMVGLAGLFGLKSKFR